MVYNRQGVSQAGTIYIHEEGCPTLVDRQSCLGACYYNYSFLACFMQQCPERYCWNYHNLATSDTYPRPKFVKIVRKFGSSRFGESACLLQMEDKICRCGKPYLPI